MRQNHYIAVLIILALLQACSSETIYEAIRSGFRQDCQTVPRSQYKDCVERTGDTYDEYSEKRKSVSEDSE